MCKTSEREGEDTRGANNYIYIYIERVRRVGADISLIWLFRELVCGLLFAIYVGLLFLGGIRSFGLDAADSNCLSIPECISFV